MVHDIEVVQEADVGIRDVTNVPIGLIREKGIGARPASAGGRPFA